MPTKSKKIKKRKHSGGGVDLTPPPVESFGFRCGASSASEEGFLCRQQAAQKQSALNQHGGGDKSECEIVIPQAPTHGMESAGPNSANKSSSDITKSLLHSNAESEYDDQVGGKKYKRKKTHRRKTKKHRRKTKRRRNKRKTKKKRGKSKK